MELTLARFLDPGSRNRQDCSTGRLAFRRQGRRSGYDVDHRMRRIKRDTAVVDAVTSELRSAILSGVLEPGSRIRQEDLAGRLAVSRAPVRQALLVLENEGLVRADRWRGAIVAPLDSLMIRDLYQFRGLIERHVATLLAGQEDFDSAPHRAVVAAGRQAASKQDISRLIELDLAFHTGLYEAVGNGVLSHGMHGLWTHVRRLMAATLTLGHASEIWDEHGAILDAIASHEGDRAGSLAASHTSAASERLLGKSARLRGEDVPAVPTDKSWKRRGSGSRGSEAVRKRKRRRRVR